MKILDRYLVRLFWPPLVWCLFTFISMTVVIDLFGHLDEILTQRVAWATVGVYYLTFTPLVFVQTMPIAMLITTAFVVGTLSRHHEVIAMKANGLSITRIVRPLIWVGLLASLATFVVSERVLPDATRLNLRIKDEIFQGRRKAAPITTLADVTLYGSQNRLFHVVSYDAKLKIMKDITILEHDRAHRVTGKLFAKWGRWDGTSWRLYQGVAYRQDATGRTVSDPRLFKELRLPITERPEDFSRASAQAEWMGPAELRRYIQRLQDTTDAPHLARLQAEWHYKVAFPFMSFVIVLLGIPFVLESPRTGNVIGGMGLSIVLGLVYYGAMAVCVAMGKGGTLPPLAAAWAAHVGFAGLGCWLIARTA